MIKIQNKSVKIKSLRFDILDFLKEEVTIALTGEDATAQAPDTRKKHGVREWYSNCRLYNKSTQHKIRICERSCNHFYKKAPSYMFDKALVIP